MAFFRQQTYRTVLSGIEHSPLALFAAGEQGAWFDPSDLSSMFQDSAGTTPVTATGQPVGRILDKSGRGNHASQATTAQKPTWEIDGNGIPYLAFDGVDDRMDVAGSGLALTGDTLFSYGGLLLGDAQTLFAAQSGPGTDNAYEYRVAGYGATAGITYIQADAAGAETINTATSGALNAGAPTLFTAYRTAANLLWKPNWAAGGNLALSKTPTVGATPSFRLGMRQDGYGPFSGRVYQLVIRGATSTTQEIENARAFIARKIGVDP